MKFGWSPQIRIENYWASSTKLVGYILLGFWWFSVQTIHIFFDNNTLGHGINNPPRKQNLATYLTLISRQTKNLMTWSASDCHVVKFPLAYTMHTNWAQSFDCPCCHNVLPKTIVRDCHGTHAQSLANTKIRFKYVTYESTTISLANTKIRFKYFTHGATKISCRDQIRFKYLYIWEPQQSLVNTKLDFKCFTYRATWWWECFSDKVLFS